MKIWSANYSNHAINIIIIYIYSDKTCIAWMHCKSLWIKESAKCINVNVNIYNTFTSFFFYQRVQEKQSSSVHRNWEPKFKHPRPHLMHLMKFSFDLGYIFGHYISFKMWNMIIIKNEKLYPNFLIVLYHSILSWRVYGAPIILKKKHFKIS